MEDPWAHALRHLPAMAAPVRLVVPTGRKLASGPMMARTDSTTFDFERGSTPSAVRAFRRGGNTDWDSAEHRAERAAVRKRAFPAFRLAAKQFFATVGLSGSDLMSKEQCVAAPRVTLSRARACRRRAALHRAFCQHVAPSVHAAARGARARARAVRWLAQVPFPALSHFTLPRARPEQMGCLP